MFAGDRDPSTQHASPTGDDREPLFDRYVVVDWSARSRPAIGPDSIWIAVAEASHDRAVELSNPSTRRCAEARLGEACVGSRRTLIVIDASIGYPVGSATYFELEGAPPWRAMWSYLESHLVDGADNRNNRFEVAAALNRRGGGEGPFWGRPASWEVVGLSRRRSDRHPLAGYRHTEEVARCSGWRPASGWQLLGAGSVGSQTMTAVPVFERLSAEPGVEVWPFTTGPIAPRLAGGATVLAETWLSVFPVDLARHPVRDACQVASVAAVLRESDRSGLLRQWMEPAIPPRWRQAVLAEEGWMLTPPLDR